MANDDTASKRSAEEIARARARFTINLQRAFNDLLVKLERAYEALESDPSVISTETQERGEPLPYDGRLMRDFYVVTLKEFVIFLDRSGVNEDIAHKFAELGSAIHELRWGAVADFLRPAVVGGRGPDGEAVWTCRKYVVIGLECILRSQKMKNKEKAAEHIADKYPIFDRLKRNPRASLPKSILSWRRTIISGRKGDVGTLYKFFEPHDLPSDEMFARGERALGKAAEETAKASL
jgi:hypothetical protein